MYGRYCANWLCAKLKQKSRKRFLFCVQDICCFSLESYNLYMNKRKVGIMVFILIVLLIILAKIIVSKDSETEEINTVDVENRLKSLDALEREFGARQPDLSIEERNLALDSILETATSSSSEMTIEQRLQALDSLEVN